MHSNEEAFQKPINPKLKYSNNFLIMHTSSVRCKCCDTSSDLKKTCVLGNTVFWLSSLLNMDCFWKKKKKEKSSQWEIIGFMQVVTPLLLPHWPKMPLEMSLCRAPHLERLRWPPASGFAFFPHLSLQQGLCC